MLELLGVLKQIKVNLESWPSKMLQTFDKFEDMFLWTILTNYTIPKTNSNFAPKKNQPATNYSGEVPLRTEALGMGWETWGFGKVCRFLYHAGKWHNLFHI